MNELLAHGLGRFILATALVGVVGIGMIVEIDEPGWPLAILVAAVYGVLLVAEVRRLRRSDGAARSSPGETALTKRIDPR